ncbi:MAG: cytochrome c maturation protein CcmE [Francisellaceae bacterium]|nr:cytochrome c maturation protein CcmE [Francisellaceae bacterium]MBT6207071.1 cytochrome c maturation protein CcmE [Francisellaceae bacterium]MBT6537995.1 cytochrome c maturation protein CcmE [Francisellaceae bacterium]
MTKLHKQRIRLFLILLSTLSIIVALVLYALTENINLFYTPTQVTESLGAKRAVKLGGMVVKGSVKYEEGLNVKFTLTDFKGHIPVVYDGILPDLFKEGQGIVAEGNLSTEGIFLASRVLAKHDENYMPPGIDLAKANGDGGNDT